MGRAPDPAKHRRLVEATLDLVRKRGYGDTSVEDICIAARVTRGSFFYYAKTKEEMALQALGLYGERFRGHFADAHLERAADPVLRLDLYLDAYVALAHSPFLRDGCYLGVLSQEIASSHPRLRARCQEMFDLWTGGVESLIADALRHREKSTQPSATLAAHIVASLEGAVLLGRIHKDGGEVERTVTHLKRYVDALLR